MVCELFLACEELPWGLQLAHKMSSSAVLLVDCTSAKRQGLTRKHTSSTSFLKMQALRCCDHS